MLSRDTDASTPRSRHHGEARGRRLRPGIRASAGANRSDPPRWPSGARSACAGAAASGTFSSQRLGQLRPADADTRLRFDFGAQAGNRQFGRSATGASSKGVTTRSAAELCTGSGPGATLAFDASMPPRPKSPRHSRTVSSRTPNASAIRGRLQPESVNKSARALSASPRPRDEARAAKAVRWPSLAVTGDFPPRPHTAEAVLTANRKTNPLVKQLVKQPDFA